MTNQPPQIKTPSRYVGWLVGRHVDGLLSRENLRTILYLIPTQGRLARHQIVTQVLSTSTLRLILVRKKEQETFYNHQEEEKRILSK